MISSGRIKIEDSIIDTDLNSNNYHNRYFVRVGSKDQTFTKVNFSHSYFDNCYFRNIKFDSCAFIGCKFVNCNFQGSSFPGSKFDYATFEKTLIDSDILDSNCPSHNNLTLKFARTLRVNYQGIGDAESVNKAIKIELKATEEHLYDSWKSKGTYYRSKYKGWKRISMFFQWINFRLQDFIWGNGESPVKLLRTGICIWIFFTIVDTFWFRNRNSISDYWDAFWSIPAAFMGVAKPSNHPELYLTVIIALRFIGFALFTSILIKRFNRR